MHKLILVDKSINTSKEIFEEILYVFFIFHKAFSFLCFKSLLLSRFPEIEVHLHVCIRLCASFHFRCTFDTLVSSHYNNDFKNAIFMVLVNPIETHIAFFSFSFPYFMILFYFIE